MARPSSSHQDPSLQVPDITQQMWCVACSDLDGAEIRLRLAHDHLADRATIKSREYDVRVRKGICNGINFLITNRADVNAVIAKKRRN